MGRWRVTACIQCGRDFHAEHVGQDACSRACVRRFVGGAKAHGGGKYPKYHAVWNSDGLRVMTASGRPVGTVQHEREVDALIARWEAAEVRP